MSHMVEYILLDGYPHTRGPLTMTANKIDEFFEKLLMAIGMAGS